MLGHVESSPFSEMPCQMFDQTSVKLKACILLLTLGETTSPQVKWTTSSAHNLHHPTHHTPHPTPHPTPHHTLHHPTPHPTPHTTRPTTPHTTSHTLHHSTHHPTAHPTHYTPPHTPHTLHRTALHQQTEPPRHIEEGLSSQTTPPPDSTRGRQCCRAQLNAVTRCDGGLQDTTRKQDEPATPHLVGAPSHLVCRIRVFRAYYCSTKHVLRNNNMASLSLCWPCITKSVLRVFLEKPSVGIDY